MVQGEFRKRSSFFSVGSGGGGGGGDNGALFLESTKNYLKT
jgi:hypothetical protein